MIPDKIKMQLAQDEMICLGTYINTSIFMLDKIYELKKDKRDLILLALFTAMRELVLTKLVVYKDTYNMRFSLAQACALHYFHTVNLGVPFDNTITKIVGIIDQKTC